MKTQSLKQVFAVPLLCAIASLVGLVAALVADGWGDALSWIALGAPVALFAWAMVKRRS